MNDLLEPIRSTLVGFDVRSAVDILIVAAIAYGLLSLIQGTTAVPLTRGIALVYLLGSAASNWLGLTMLGWLLRTSLPALLVAVPILFQPEIRRALEQVGRARDLTRWARAAQPNEPAIETLAASAARLAEKRWGALMVLERQTPLGEYASTGTHMDAELSAELVLTIFSPHSPLHDGAVIVRGDRIVAAGCVLPLPETVEGRPQWSDTGHSAAPPEYGFRHRAGIGITEKTDALTVIVSETTGNISFANNGRLVQNLDDQRLQRVLAILYRPRSADGVAPVFRMPVRSRTS
ncbi:MAG TPA: diadenylate cyclase CdaA [Chloroflexota bacterium]